MRTGSILVVGLALTLIHCDDRTAEEKGADYAEEKIGFAEGAAGVLEDKGKALGKSAGTGVSDLVRGAGSAVKDAVHPPVKVTVDEKLATSVKVMEAHEGPDAGETRTVVATLDFPERYVGRLQLRAVGEGGEMGRSLVSPNIEMAAGDHQTWEFSFQGGMRLSKVDHFRLVGFDAKTVEVVEKLKNIQVSQLKEQGSEVTAYVTFEKAYRGGLQLRAHDTDGKEIGRSEPTHKLAQVADSATYLGFTFDQRTPLKNATRYVLHSAKPKSDKR